jgi:hypothetical protein
VKTYFKVNLSENTLSKFEKHLSQMTARTAGSISENFKDSLTKYPPKGYLLFWAIDSSSNGPDLFQGLLRPAGFLPELRRGQPPCPPP